LPASAQRAEHSGPRPRHVQVPRPSGAARAHHGSGQRTRHSGESQAPDRLAVRHDARARAGANQLNNPNSAELLENAHVLIADENNNRVIEVTTGKQLVRQFTAAGTVNGAAFASRLRNGNTLITDANNNRIVEVNAADTVVWEYRTDTESGTNSAPLPTRAVRLANGNTLISDQFNNRVIEITPAKDIVFQQGVLNTRETDSTASMVPMMPRWSATSPA